MDGTHAWILEAAVGAIEEGWIVSAKVTTSRAEPRLEPIPHERVGDGDRAFREAVPIAAGREEIGRREEQRIVVPDEMAVGLLERDLELSSEASCPHANPRNREDSRLAREARADELSEIAPLESHRC